MTGKVDGLDTADLLGSHSGLGHLLGSSLAAGIEGSSEVSALLHGRAGGLLEGAHGSAAGSSGRHDVCVCEGDDGQGRVSINQLEERKREEE